MQSVTKRANAYKMSDNEGEIEDVSFLGAQTDKRSVYEPKDFQRCRQLVCSQTRAIIIVVLLCLLALTIALIAAFATPSLKSCSLEEPTKAKPEKPQQFIATNGEKFPWTNIRLPDHVAPLVYRLFMHPNLTTFHFRGTVEIDFVVNQQTDCLIFHSKKLNISSHDLMKKGTKENMDIVKSLEYLEFEQIYLKLGSSLKKGEVYTLKMAFVGLLSDSLAGFYKSSYETSAGDKMWLATTHFEPTDARAAFPCFDEPQLKANFSLSMVRDEKHISLFNTQKLQEETSSESPHLKIDHFAISVKMSTYLVAFVVCDYGQISAYTANDNGTKVSVYAPKDHLHQANFACDSAASILAKYENFFGEKYPLQKQDLIAIPDFAAGAMENWGLITYRFTAILFDEKESSASNKQWVAVVVAHELAHQWFGNLVTMKWWDDLWLNEGFASYVEYIGASYVAPKWNMMDQFIADTLVQALHQDSLSNSHPISVPVYNPAQINEIFDAISYDKGASIIRMLDGFLSRPVLQNGLKTYLTRHKYGNAETDDLWQALSDEAKKSNVDVDVKRVMDTWTKQMGFPLITAHRDGDVITVTQKRFLLNPRGNQSKEFESPFGYKWNIPLTYSTSKDRHTFMKWFEKDKDSFALKHQPTWYKLNVDQVGFYRVHYDDDNWQSIIKQLNTDHTVFSSADRAGLLDDVFALARSGELDATIALQLSQYLKKETEYVPWSVGLDGLQYIGHLLEDKPSYGFFSKFLLDLLEVQLNKTTWRDDGEHLEKFLRALVLGEAILLYHKPSVEQGKQLFKRWMTTGEKVPANLKNMVYHAGVRYGGPEEWNFAWDQYTKTDVPSEKKKLLYALSRTTDGLQLDRYLRMAVDVTKVRKADTVLVVSYIALNPAGRVLAWRFVKQNWQLFYDRYGIGGFEMTRLVTKVTKSFTTQYDHDEVAEFFANHLAGSGKRAVSQTLESIQMNIDWLNRNEKPVVDWLQTWAKSKSNQ